MANWFGPGAVVVRAQLGDVVAFRAIRMAMSWNPNVCDSTIAAFRHLLGHPTRTTHVPAAQLVPEFLRRERLHTRVSDRIGLDA